MWSSLPTTLGALLLIATQIEAHTDGIHARHHHKHRLDKLKAAPPAPGVIQTDIEYTTVLVTLTVQPVPIDPTTVYKTVTDVEGGVFPPGASGSGTGTIGTGIPSNQTDALPTFTRPTSVGPSLSATLTGFPVFTGKPVVDISGSPQQSAPAASSTNASSSSLKPSLTQFPVFTGSPVISIPTELPTIIAPGNSRGDEYGGAPPPAASTFPAFTSKPVVSIPDQSSSAAPAPSKSPTQSSSSSAANSAPTFPPFTGAPVVVIPGATQQSAAAVSTQEPTPSAPASAGPLPFLKGVNLGGWLVLEKWMTEDLFTGAFSSAKDQYTFDSLPGAQEALQKHWSTFFTESDIASLASAGFNALRIPIGYWSYDNSGTPYQSGADAFLEQAIGWARNHNMKVLVDCHGSPGSQNGFDNSGEAGAANWQQPSNLQKSIDVLKVMAKKYGSNEYADVVFGLQMVNEPISWGNNNFDVTKSWTEQAYQAVKAEVENPNLLIVMHDAFQGGVAWESVSSTVKSSTAASVSGKAIDANAFAVDEHLYQLFTDSFNAMNQDQHVAAACAWGSSLAASTSFQKTIVGEFSAATNICLMKDGSTIAGTSCSEDGCECQTGDWTKWSQGMKDQMRRFVEAQLEAFEANSAGYFAWSAKAPGGWGVLNLLGNGVWPQNGERKFAGVCGGQKRDVGARSMRRGLRR